MKAVSSEEELPSFLANPQNPPSVETYVTMIMLSGHFDFKRPDFISCTAFNPDYRLSQNDGVQKYITGLGLPFELENLHNILSRIYFKSWEKTYSLLFNENSTPEGLKPLIKLIEMAESDTDSLPATLFKAQLLGIGFQVDRVKEYALLHKLCTKNGANKAIYERCLSIIDDSFEGVKGNEDYWKTLIVGFVDSTFSIPQADPKIKRLKNKIFWDHKRELPFPSNYYAGIFLDSPRIIATGSEGGERYLEFEVKDCPRPIKIDLTFPEDPPAWDLLYPPEKIPEIYKALVSAGNEILRLAVEKLLPEQNRTIAIIEEYDLPQKPLKTHPVDPELEQARQENKDSRGNNNTPVTREGSKNEKATPPTYAITDDTLKENFDKKVREAYDLALEKFEENHIIKPLKTGATDNRKLFALRHADYRFIFQNFKDNKLRLISGGKRDTVYVKPC